jgi:hypothetical protein
MSKGRGLKIWLKAVLVLTLTLSHVIELVIRFFCFDISLSFLIFAPSKVRHHRSATFASGAPRRLQCVEKLIEFFCLVTSPFFKPLSVCGSGEVIGGPTGLTLRSPVSAMLWLRNTNSQNSSSTRLIQPLDYFQAQASPQLASCTGRRRPARLQHQAGLANWVVGAGPCTAPSYVRGSAIHQLIPVVSG